MEHRHLNHADFTPAAIDDVIERGRWADWVALRKAVLQDDAVLHRVERLCAARTSDASDPYAQRHQFWMNYVQAHRPAA